LTGPAVAELKDTAGTIALVAAIVAAVAAVAALAGCSTNSDCAYYGGADASTRCVVVGPSPHNGGQ
jgi:hypothetical protein